MALLCIEPGNLVIFHQERDNWCWAATTSYVASCLGQFTAQCTVAEASLSTCKGNCHGASCDSPYYLTEALKTVKRFGKWRQGPATLREVKREILEGRPLGVRIGWANGTGHFVLIVGVGYSASRPNIPRLAIFDPLPDVGLHIVRATTLGKNRYQTTGKWTETIFTR